MSRENGGGRLEAIAKGNSLERRRAARAFWSGQLSPEEREALGKALADEPDEWVRSALHRAIEGGESSSAPSEPAGAGVGNNGRSVESDVVEGVRAEALLEAVRILLHELRPIVGILDLSASKEVENYEGSRTCREMDVLRQFLSTIERLGDASRVAQPTSEDVSSAIYSSVERVSGGTERIFLARSDPVVVSVDWALVDLAFSNALRNAIDATSSNLGRIVVNWGETDRDSWIVVLDEGVGLPVGADPFEPGITTRSRSRDRGWGLAIAKRAMESVGGRIQLTPRSGRGTSCEIRW